MEHFASNIKIQNFKSIRELELNDCNRINLLIGRPNVGKSNILEAMSLFSLPYLTKNGDYPNLKDLIRIEKFSEFFFNGEEFPPNSVYIDDKSIRYDYSGFLTLNIRNDEYIIGIEKDLNLNFGDIDDLEVFESSYPFKNYFYPSTFKFTDSFFIAEDLIPPHGENLYHIIQSDKELKEEFLALFREYGLHLVFDKSSQELKIMKGVENGEIFLIPFSSIADSLQRLIFYKTAIKNNENSVITFEEPEAHTYPPYIAQITRDIIDARTNQFFITTHSPYVVNELLENAQEELAIYMVDFKDGQTVARRLTNEELDEVYNDGIDLFFNNEFFA